MDSGNICRKLNGSKLCAVTGIELNQRVILRKVESCYFGVCFCSGVFSDTECLESCKVLNTVKFCNICKCSMFCYVYTEFCDLGNIGFGESFSVCAVCFKKIAEVSIREVLGIDSYLRFSRSFIFDRCDRSIFSAQNKTVCGDLSCCGFIKVKCYCAFTVFDIGSRAGRTCEFSIVRFFEHYLSILGIFICNNDLAALFNICLANRYPAAPIAECVFADPKFALVKNKLCCGERHPCSRYVIIILIESVYCADAVGDRSCIDSLFAVPIAVHPCLRPNNGFIGAKECYRFGRDICLWSNKFYSCNSNVIARNADAVFLDGINCRFVKEKCMIGIISRWYGTAEIGMTRCDNKFRVRFICIYSKCYFERVVCSSVSKLSCINCCGTLDVVYRTAYSQIGRFLVFDCAGAYSMTVSGHGQTVFHHIFSEGKSVSTVFINTVCSTFYSYIFRNTRFRFYICIIENCCISCCRTARDIGIHSKCTDGI